MRVAIASCTALPPQFTDDLRIAEALAERGVSATQIPWDDPGTEWSAFEAVVIRSTWDYAGRREEFLRWCDSVGPSLHNCAALVHWSSDKRYLADLAAVGIPVVETEFVAPGEEIRSPARSSSSPPSRPGRGTRVASGPPPTISPAG